MTAPSGIKVILVGPSASRKTLWSSYLGGMREHLDGDELPNFVPTSGARVLEMDRGGTSVELWDVSGA
jgi:hypothetical protein